MKKEKRRLQEQLRRIKRNQEREKQGNTQPVKPVKKKVRKMAEILGYMFCKILPPPSSGEGENDAARRKMKGRKKEIRKKGKEREKRAERKKNGVGEGIIELGKKKGSMDIMI